MILFYYNSLLTVILELTFSVFLSVFIYISVNSYLLFSIFNMSMDLIEGQAFSSYYELEKTVESFANFVILSKKKDTRTLEDAKKTMPQEKFQGGTEIF